MREADENLKQLEHAFTLYCVQLRRYVPRNGGKHDTSVPLKELLEKLPIMADIDNTLASPIYVEKVISCAIADDRIMTLIWEEHFCRQATIADVAKRANYSPRSISRLIELFPKKVAHQLWMKNHELANPQKTLPSTKTLRQQQQEIISQTWGLTNRQAEIMLTFAMNKTQGRKEVALELEISKNTVKFQMGKIFKKMKVSKLSEAVDKVRMALWAGESDVKQI